MSKTRLALLALLLAMLFGLGLVLGVLLPRMAIFNPSPRVYNTAVILQEVQTLSQLVTVKYVMEKVVILEDPPQNPVRRLLPDETRVILVAHGIVKAGVDLSQLTAENVRLRGKTIEVSLPKSQITDAYLDEKQTKIIEHNTSFLRDFNKDLEQNARQTAVDDIRRAARTAGILKDADERARAQLKNLGNQLGFEVEFR
ncbi:MAG TPA: DUF4230 domain-containing protein [Candidatus Dormibacteraeota bacterium]|nr:DUF4230 domain-containing protein [Candidatus Dormibacteraeota bacterium]